jgi:uncharacterized membrane protein YGL010W
MISFIEQAQRYAALHYSRVTWYTHLAGIPLVVFSFIIFFGFFHIVVPNWFDIKFADLLVLGILVYYFRLNWLLALSTTPVFILMLWLADLINYNGPTSFALWAFVVIFLLGAAFQLVGHLIQGNKPAFVKYPYDALAAPLFITAELYFMAGKLKGLQQEIHGDESVVDNKPNTKSSKQ